MILNRSLTATVYIICEKKVLLHKHKKYKTLFPVGGHMLPDELPHETAIREAKEESGLEVILYNPDNNLPFSNVKQVVRPMHILLENIGQAIENIDFIFFATVSNNEVKPNKDESKELFWLTKEEVQTRCDIENHIKIMALEALRVIDSQA